MIVTVAEGGLLSLTQQMDAFHQLGSPPRTSHLPVNPFVSSNNKYGGKIDFSRIPFLRFIISRVQKLMTLKIPKSALKKRS